MTKQGRQAGDDLVHDERLLDHDAIWDAVRRPVDPSIAAHIDHREGWGDASEVAGDVPTSRTIPEPSMFVASMASRRHSAV